MGTAATVGTQVRDAWRALIGATDSTSQTEADAVVSRVQYLIPKATDTGAGTDETWNGPTAKCQFVVTAVTFAPDAAVTANGTNFGTLTLSFDDGAGGAATSVASVDTSAVSWVAGTRVTFTITAANALVASGKQLKLVKTHGGTGVVMARGTLEVLGYIQ